MSTIIINSTTINCTDRVNIRQTYNFPPSENMPRQNSNDQGAEVNGLLDRTRQYIQRHQGEIASLWSIGTTVSGQTASGYLQANTIAPLNELSSNLASRSTMNPSAACELLDNCPVDVVVQNRDLINRNLTDPSCGACDPAIIDSLNNTIQSYANGVMLISLVTNVAFILIEFYRLRQFWHNIKDARNLINTSIRARDDVNEKMRMIEINLADLQAVYDRLLNGENDLDLNDIYALMDDIRQDLAEVYQNLVHLEFSINGSKERLQSAKRLNKISLITNGVNILATAAHIALLVSVVNPILLGLNVACVVTFTIIGSVSLRAHHLSKEQLRNLDRELGEIVELQRKRNQFNEAFLSIRNDIRQHLRTNRTRALIRN